MAWQLIYTSAPRSLEAGRSGFGTVARHRAISPLLVSAIERTSQFSRLPGTDAGRVIFCHRIIAVAGGRFHVLSAIRDAGADYTGRTNHIAHHLIVDPREIAQLGPDGPSPADVLLTMRWATSWNEPPRFLEASDEVALSAIHPLTNGSAWEQIAGSASQAWLLATGDASRGAYIIQPASTDLRPVFAESLRLIPERLWQITFTTSLQPSDEPADFRWIGIEDRSPLRAQSESSGRPVLNLALPDTLPLIEMVQPVATGLPNSFSRPPAKGASLSSSLDAPPLVSESSLKPSQQPSQQLSQKNRETNAPSMEAKTMFPALWKWVVGSAAVILLSITWFAFVAPFLRNRSAEEKERGEIAPLINAAVDSARTSTTSKEYPNLSLISLTDLRRLRNLANFTHEMIEAMRAVDFQKMSEADDRFTKERQEASKSSLQVPVQFDNVQKRLHDSTQLHAELEKFQQKPEDYSAFKKLQDAAKKVRELDADSAKHADKLQVTLHSLYADKEASALLALLKGEMEPKPEGKIEWFTKETSNGEERHPAMKEKFRPVRDLLEDWKFVENQDSKKELADLRTRIAKSSGWPSWLRVKAQKIIGSAPGNNAVAPAEAMMHTGTSTPARNSQTQTTINSPELHFIAENKGMSIDLPQIGPLKFHFRQGGSSENKFDLLKPFSGDIKFGLGEDGARFKVPNGKLEPGSNPPKPPYELSIRNQDSSEVLHIYVGPPDNSQQLIADKSLELKRDDHLIRITGAFPRIAESAKPNFMLVTPAGFDGSKQVKTFAVTATHDCELKDVLSNLQGQIAERRNEANRLSQQADKESADAQSVEGIRKRATEYVATLKKEDAKKAFNPKSKTGAELVGDFAKALADEWNEKKNKNKFGELREAGRALGDAFGKPEDAKIKNKELQSEVRKLQNNVSGQEKISGLAALSDLCDKLAAVLGDAAAIETKISKLRTRAENAEREAKQIESQPLLNGKLPPGKYTLTVQFKDMNLNLYTFTVN